MYHVVVVIRGHCSPPLRERVAKCQGHNSGMKLANLASGDSGSWYYLGHYLPYRGRLHANNPLDPQPLPSAKCQVPV